MAALLGQLLTAVGILTTVVGLMGEFVGVAAIASYRLRRRLPFKSPITLVSLGGTCFFAGLFIVWAGSLLR